MDEQPFETTPPAPPPDAIPAVDMMAFAQMLATAGQCGLPVNVDVLVSVRDNEFRAGKYQRAFDVVERTYMQFNADAARRQSELLREETRYKSGALKMSPKEWLQRQRRETEKTQRIEAARRHFIRVLDGLSSLRATEVGQAVADVQTSTGFPRPGDSPPAADNADKAAN
jgi:hypothetical protein